MTLNEFQLLANRTSNQKLASIEHIENGVMGLCGESGECIDIYKKYRFQGHDLDFAHLVDELSDVMWYAAELASGLGIMLEDVAQHNVDKLRKRYSEGFDSEKSIHRQE